PGKKGEKTKGKAACIETETGPVPNMAHKEDEESEWIFDSGCTEYITYLSNILVNKKATHFDAPIVIPNGDSIPVIRKGDYVLPEGTKLNGVLYVPDFKCNLLSVNRTTEEELDWCGEMLRGTVPNEDNSRKKGHGYHC
ncbi:hypothetical protein Tco_0954353, partial [Tanacetum coccineum]